MANKHLIHAHSSVVTNGQPKLPASSRIEYGELAVNFAEGYETLSIRNSNDDIVTFSSDDAIKKIIIDNEKVIASALNDLDSKIDNSNTDISDINDELEEKVDKLVSKTYAQLKSMRDNSELKPGQFYRITDYTTTTVQADTRSANHRFDIIVLATDVNTLNENAKAIKHAGDTYFADSNLNAWELKYSLENDDTKFAWADTTNGKGVIYYMKDEWNNECPYDFKNIQFKRWAITDITSTTLTSGALSSLNDMFNFNNNNGKHFASKSAYGEWFPSGNNITITVDNTESGWYYTFNGMSSEDGETIEEYYDLSTKQFKLTEEFIEINENNEAGSDISDICTDNKIFPLNQEYYFDDVYYKGRLVLNNIVFINGPSYCFYNDNDEYWEYETSLCYANELKNNCCNNTFGDDCFNNTFGDDCYNNTFGDNCRYNTFGNNCGGNTFGDSCINTFGNNCGGNTFGKHCYDNTFVDNCRSNTFGDYSVYNTFVNYCCGNTFGDSCCYNTFEVYCNDITFGNSCYNNTFGNNCAVNTFGNNCGGNTFGNNVAHVTFIKDYCHNNIVENGNMYITLTSTQTTSSNNFLMNIKISQGVNNTSTLKTISHNTVNDAFQTVYQNSNSTIVNV